MLFALWLAAAPAAADEFGRNLRSLAADDRERRLEALEKAAKGLAGAESGSEERRLAARLRRFLRDGRPADERALAVTALGRLRDYEAILARLPSERDDRVLAAAERAFSGAPERALDPAERALERAEDLGRGAVARAAVAVRGERARALARGLASEAGPWTARAAGALALGRAREPSSFPPLIALLDAEEPGLRAAAAESLARLTGLPHGLDLLAWKRWWAREGAKNPLPPPVKPEAERRYAHEAEPAPIVPYYFGIPVRGRDVVFCFDVSASMRYKLPVAYEELSRAVMGLPSTARFDVVFFNEFLHPWRDRLCSADPVTKELLVRHLPTIEIKSYTNLFGALERALEMEPDEVFLISDGEPNRGRKQMPREILAELERILPRGTRVHTVSVVRTVDGHEHVALLRDIASLTGGRSVERTLR